MVALLHPLLGTRPNTHVPLIGTRTNDLLVRKLALSPLSHTSQGGNVWVLDFVQERFHDMSPGDFESTFIKAGGSETKKRLKIEEVRLLQQE